MATTLADGLTSFWAAVRDQGLPSSSVTLLVSDEWLEVFALEGPGFRTLADRLRQRNIENCSVFGMSLCRQVELDELRVQLELQQDYNKDLQRKLKKARKTSARRLIKELLRELQSE